MKDKKVSSIVSIIRRWASIAGDEWIDSRREWDELAIEMYMVADWLEDDNGPEVFDRRLVDAMSYTERENFLSTKHYEEAREKYP